jgi:hypothetical protein
MEYAKLFANPKERVFGNSIHSSEFKLVFPFIPRFINVWGHNVVHLCPFEDRPLMHSYYMLFPT